ncbi:Uncharacterised protein [Yersinia aldovae]|uniref:hypothetical protein n=1 Tax=Yersinia aldovae TaxID=29483 RepID=UPI0005E90913|nr:hypothetical protein [Yersinia aldovae]CNK29422.1 Uncharacterised protein [Yersinia aldovae]
MTKESKIESQEIIELKEDIELKIGSKDEMRCIYIGPTLQNLDLRQFTVFLGGLPTEAEVLKQKVPLSTQLFISVSELGNKTALLDDPTSAESVAYRAVIAELRSGDNR